MLVNHDVVRHPTRYGGGPVGLARARAATLAMLALPGSAYLYQGEELGLEQVDVPPEARQDPSWFRTGEPGRDGCRVPMPWAATRRRTASGRATASRGSPSRTDWADLTVEAQEADDALDAGVLPSALAARRDVGARRGRGVRGGGGSDVLVVRRGDVTVVLNAGQRSVKLPAGEVLISSGPVGDRLPPDTAVWLRG